MTPDDGQREGSARYVLSRSLYDHDGEMVALDVVRQEGIDAGLGDFTLDELGNAALWLRARGDVDCNEHDVAELRRPLFARLTPDGMEKMRLLDEAAADAARADTNPPPIVPVPIDRRRACRSALLSWLYDHHGTQQPTPTLANFFRDTRSIYDGDLYAWAEVAAAAEYLEDGLLAEFVWGMSADGRLPARGRIKYEGVRHIEEPESRSGAAMVNLIYFAGDVTETQIQQGSARSEQHRD